MANNPGAKKAIRKIAARTEVNKARRTRVRTFLRKFQEAVTGGDALHYNWGHISLWTAPAVGGRSHCSSACA
jgi:hypothetical protein